MPRDLLLVSLKTEYFFTPSIEEREIEEMMHNTQEGVPIDVVDLSLMCK